MANESEKFAVWAELAAGEESSQFIPLIDLALHIGTDPHRVMKAALALKLEMGGTHGHVMWLKGVPWFSAVIATAIQEKIKAEVLENIKAMAEQKSESSEAQNRTGLHLN